LQSVSSRRKFLEDQRHRVRFVFLPRHSSWLNQIETVFGIIMREVICRGNFPSVADLKAKLYRILNTSIASSHIPFAGPAPANRWLPLHPPATFRHIVA
jgi:transposase